MSRHIAAVVLAAGASTRLGQPKQLVRFNGEQLIDRAIRIAHEAGASCIFVVLGCDHERILEAIAPVTYDIRILLNKGWRHGMATSIALGVTAAERMDADEVLVLACDQVMVTPEHLQQLIIASKRERVVASQYQDRGGIPALFPEFAFHALQELTGDHGARDVLQGDSVLTVPLAGGQFDIDTPADLERLRRMEHRGLAVLDDEVDETEEAAA
jgi:molybdenum cofactor cytidylyltransferase